MKKILILLFFSVTVFIYQSCNKNEDTETPPLPTPPGTTFIKDLNATDTVHYTFFRFKDSTAVPFTDSNTTNWDIAFNKTRIIVNSGASGPGKGGVIILKGTTFESVTTAPETGYSYDTTSTKLALIPSSNKGWYSYDMTSMVITPIAGQVLVFKTADEKYVKLQFISYYKGNPTTISISDISKYYWFKYVYQKNGTRNFN